MTGYVRKDTTNNIADGNVINSADFDNEFDGIQDAFNSTTGHNHDGTTGEGAPILTVGPTQDVVASATALTPKTTATVDIGSSSLKFKDLNLSGSASIGGTLAVTGVATLTAAPILSSLTASSSVATNASKALVSVTNTGTGNNVLATSPTLVTPALGTPSSGVVTNLTGTASININGTVGATTANTGAFTTLNTSDAASIGGALSVTGTMRSVSTTITGSSGGTITPTSDSTNQYTITALGASATFAIPSGSPIDGQKLTIRIKDDATIRSLTWTTTSGGYRVVGALLPTTTVASKVTYVGCIYNSQDSFWDVVSTVTQV